MIKRWLRQWGSIVVAMLIIVSAVMDDITPVYGALSDDSFEEDNSYLDDTYSSTDRDDMLAVNTDDDTILNDTTNDELSENVDLTEEDKVTADDVIFEEETVSENVSDVDGDNEGFEISPDGGNVNSDSYKSPTNPYSNKGYTGQCTWYAWGRAREKLGISLPFTGDAKNWRAMAEASGFQTGDSPRSNSIMVMRPNCSCKGASYGHVVFIESVHGSTMTVSEGNSSKVANGVEYDVPVMNTGGTNTGYWNCPDEWNSYRKLNPYIVSGYIYLGSDIPGPGYDMGANSPYARTIDDGDYVLISALDPTLTLDIDGDRIVTGETNVHVWHGLERPYDVFSIKRLSNGYYKLTQRDSNNVALSVGGRSLYGGYPQGNIQMYRWAPESLNNTEFQWAIEDVGNGYYTLYARCSGFCLDVVNGESANGTEVVQWPSNETNAQKWLILPAGKVMSSGAGQTVKNGNYMLVSALDNNITLDIDGDRIITGETNVHAWSGLSNRPYDIFTVTYLNNGYYKLVQKGSSNVALSVSGRDFVAGGKKYGNIQMWKWQPQDLSNNEFQWSISGVGNGYYKLEAKCSGLCVDIEGSNKANGTNISQYPYKGTNNQKWKFISTDAPTITTSSLPNGTTGKSYSTTISATSDTAITWSCSGALPAGLTFSNGKISGTPTKAGTYNITVTAKNTFASSSKTYSIKIAQATVSVTGVSLNKSSTNIVVGKTETLTATVTPSNATNKSVTWSSDNTNVATVSSAGVVTAKSAGTVNITVKTADGNKTATCKVTVVTTPVITTTKLPDGEVGKSYSAKLIASGTTPVTWSKTAGSLPDGLTLSSDGTISGTPTVASRFIVTVQAKNSYGNSPTKQLTINIGGIAPTITYDSGTAVQGGGPIKPSEIGKPYSFTFTAEGTAPLKWSIVSGALPAGLSLNSQTGEISGIATQLGSKDFRIRVENLYGSAEESYYINIYTNVPNIVTESLPDGVVGEEYFVNIDTTNYDVDGDISKLYVSEGLQLNEWLDNPEIITGWGHKITGVPKKAGTFIFTLTVENSYGKSSKKFTVNIKSPKTEPNPGNDTIKGKDSTIVAGQKINLSKICFAGIGTPISRYLVNDKKVASVSKTMLSGKTVGTVNVTAQASVGKNKYEDVAICTVTVLSRPKLKFTLPMTYEGQMIDASDYFITTDTNILGATYWESSNPAVVEVTNASKGTLKAHNEGNVNISAYFGEKGKNGTLKVTTSLKMKKPAFQKSSYKLQTGAKMTLAMKNVTAALNPVWHAEDNRIINVYPQIDKKGNKTGKVIVEGLSYGDTRLIANINGQQYVCNVSVTAPKINKAKLTIKVTKSATVSLSGTKIKKSEVKWYSSNSNVAVVDANGKIWAISKGEAIIYTETGGFRNECVVTVK